MLTLFEEIAQKFRQQRLPNQQSVLPSGNLFSEIAQKFKAGVGRLTKGTPQGEPIGFLSRETLREFPEARKETGKKVITGIVDFIKEDQRRYREAAEIHNKMMKGEIVDPEKGRWATRELVLRGLPIGTIGKAKGFIPKGIPKELQPLAQEARKFKSAEEFVDNLKNIIRKATSKSELSDLSKEQLQLRETILGKEVRQSMGRSMKGEETPLMSAFNEFRAKGKYPSVVGEDLQPLKDFYNQAVRGVKPTILGIPKELEQRAIKLTPAGKQTEQAFLRSGEQSSVGKLREIEFEIGTYGRNAIIRKVGQVDRVPLEKLGETIENVVSVYRAGGDPSNFRYDNLVWVTRMPNNELRAVVTRVNSQGKEEVINLFKIGREPRSFIENLRKFGALDRNRTGIFGLENQGFIRLSYEDILRIAEPKKAVKGVPLRPPVKPPIRPTEAIPPEAPQNTIQKLIKAIDESVPLRGEQRKLYQQELARRTARVAAMGEKVAGEKGFFAQLGQLKGALPKRAFEVIRNQFSQKEVDLLFDTIEQTKTLLPLEKVGTKEGLRKLFEGVVPTKGEIESLREVFPKELIDALLARRPILARMTELGVELTNVPRTMMATTDLSFGFRQGVFMIGRPKQFFPAFKEQFKFFASEKAYQGLMEGIKARPTYLKMKQAGLALTEIGGQITKREEVFMGNLAEKIPLYGRLVRASNRAYTGFANKLRADLFDDLLKKAQIAGEDIDDNLLKTLADFINSGTGRGKFGLKETGILPKSMERAAPVMNALFFSPRLMASRLNLINPYFYIQLDPFVRKEALKTLFADAGIFASIYGLWKLNGGEVGLDPRSADFGKVKIGNSRFDILGGFQQYIRLAAQLISGEVISSTTGRTTILGEGFKPLTHLEIAQRFFENKTSPIASFLIGLAKKKTATGEDFDFPAEFINRFIPMVVQDLYDISQERGAEGLLYGLPAIFGVGVQTYGKQELIFGESRLGEPTAQIRPVPELAEKIRELVIGQLPLGTSKSFSVESYFDQLSDLPKEEANAVWRRIKEANPDLAKKISDVAKERQKGITVKDKDLKAKGVASGDRALALKKEFDKLKTKEEKNALWRDYVKKGVITKEVARQLKKLLNLK